MRNGIPEGGTTSGLRNAPAELVFALLRVVDVPPSVRESDGVVVVQLRNVVRPMQLWDVVLERVLRVGREDVAGDDLVDRCLCVRPLSNASGERTVVCRHSTLKPLLFMRRRRCERGLKRFHGGGGHPIVQSMQPKHIHCIDMIRMYNQIGTVRGGRRTVRMADRTQRRARLHVEGPHVRGGAKELDTDETVK